MGEVHSEEEGPHWNVVPCEVKEKKKKKVKEEEEEKEKEEDE